MSSGFSFHLQILIQQAKVLDQIILYIILRADKFWFILHSIVWMVFKFPLLDILEIN